MTVFQQDNKDEEEKIGPDEIIDEIGGCGRFQIRMSIIAHMMKTIVCFSFAGMVIFTAPPDWWCESDAMLHNMTSCSRFENQTSVNYCQKHSCYTANGSQCSSYGFDDSLSTAINEFNLVCDQDFIPSTINSIQLAGIMFGNLISGQISDLFGRKRPMFMSIVIIMAANLLGFFSTCWEMFAAAAFFTGVGGGFFLTTHYCLLSEFSPAKWRVWITGFPSWPVQGCFLSLVSWLLHDWRYIQLVTAIMALPFLLSWFVIPESFRWYLAHDKPERAGNILRSVAKYNKHNDVNFNKALKKPEDTHDRRYTVLDLFKTKYLIRISLLSSLSWFALGFCSFGLAFGIQSLSGNIHFNLFLFSLTGIPSKVIALWLQNRFGRRASCMLCFVIVMIGGFIVGIVQTTDAPHKDALTNAFALFANTGIVTAWGPIQTMTIELYPTVIRNVGFGTLSVTGRIGGIIAMQIVYLNMHVPGLLFYVCASISVATLVSLIFLPETMDKNLTDKIKENNNLNNKIVPA